MSELFEQIHADYEARKQLGIKNYGKTVDKAGLSARELIFMAYEEALDLVIYLKEAINELERNDSRAEDRIPYELKAIKGGGD